MGISTKIMSYICDEILMKASIDEDIKEQFEWVVFGAKMFRHENAGALNGKSGPGIACFLWRRA